MSIFIFDIFVVTSGQKAKSFSIGLIFVWFGFLKPFGISPAQELVTNTVYWFDDKVSFVKFLGWWEVVIGITMCIKPLIRISIFLLFLQNF